MSSASRSDYGRIAVLAGGDSAEREVALASGAAVHAALHRQQQDALLIDGLADLCACLRAGSIDRVFNVMHGRGGEDGVVQGLLAAYGIPCTGSDVLGSALSMDKQRSKQIWQQLGLPTPAAVLIDGRAPVAAQLQQHQAQIEAMQALVVKPNREGSTVGLSLVDDFQSLRDALTMAARHDPQVLIEQRIDGEDYTVALLGNDTLPHIRIRPAKGLYDYTAKYHSDDTRYDSPVLDDADRQRLRQLTLQACAALGVSGWGRVDYMRDRQGRFWLLEANTVPGMTAHSLVPMAARAAGMDFDQLVLRILETSR
ncbi:MAG: D-alanine--D-alanine ligase [Wenzhouxiangellaceae bacterium]